MTSLIEFIRENADAIMDEWERFARATAPAGLSSDDLRNDARAMLAFIAADMGSAQSPEQQQRKGEGQVAGDDASAAFSHGSQRFSHGFKMRELVAEYRALRGTVIRLWAQHNVTPLEVAMEQLVRFNEGIDQAVSESVARFTAQVDTSRNLLLAALGHDLRTPLNAIALSAEGIIREPGATDSMKRKAARIVASANGIASIANDLLDFARTRMGGTLPLRVERADIALIGARVVSEVQETHPGASVQIEAIGETTVEGDAARIAQAICNLVLNAVQHGAADPGVTVTIEGTHAYVAVTVSNQGTPIPDADMPRLFEPWVHGESGAPSNAGLGLYIVREIALAHGAEVAVDSTLQRTSFRIAWPRLHTPAATQATRVGPSQLPPGAIA